MWDLGLGGKTVLVTGGGSGIGRAVAIEASHVGAKVVVVGRDKGRLDETLSDCLKGDHLAISWDLSKIESLDALVTELVGSVGPLDGAVHAAGLYSAEPLRVVTPVSMESLLRINLVAPYILTKSIAKKPNHSVRASIVFIGSVSSKKGQGGAISYSVSKAALSSGIRPLVSEFRGRGIRFNAIVAGLVESDFSDGIRRTIGEAAWLALVDAHPLGVGSPKEIADATLFLLSQKSKWVTGVELVVDGGYLA